MLQHIITAGMWAFFGWYLAAHVASLTGVPVSIAPVGAVGMAIITVVDWPGLIGRALAPARREVVRDPR